MPADRKPIASAFLKGYADVTNVQKVNLHWEAWAGKVGITAYSLTYPHFLRPQRRHATHSPDSSSTLAPRMDGSFAGFILRLFVNKEVSID